MPVKIGLVGLPNVGKSTIFNALSAGESAVGNYPFTTRDRHVGVVARPDPRLATVAQALDSGKVTPAGLEVVDIAGLVRGASQGEGLGNQFLAHIREVDVIAHVVRTFVDPTVSESGSAVDPTESIEVVETELLLADLQQLEKSRAKVEIAAKGKRRQDIAQLSIIDHLIEGLSKGIPARNISSYNKSEESVRDFQLLTDKQVILVANINETASSADALQAVQQLATRQSYSMVMVNAKLAHEVSVLDPVEQQMFSGELAAVNTSVIIDTAVKLLEMITFFTGNSKETRAWLCQSGTPAKCAGGLIHTDMARGFISCETIRWDRLAKAGSWLQAKEQGSIRVEGSEYRIQDGDVCLFRFNV